MHRLQDNVGVRSGRTHIDLSIQFNQTLDFGFPLADLILFFLVARVRQSALIKEDKAWVQLSWDEQQSATTTADCDWLKHLSIEKTQPKT